MESSPTSPGSTQNMRNSFVTVKDLHCASRSKRNSHTSNINSVSSAEFELGHINRNRGNFEQDFSLKSSQFFSESAGEYFQK